MYLKAKLICIPLPIISPFATGCTDLIMEDAKKKKDEWTKRLCDFEVESLSCLRDALLARGSMLTMTSADIKDIVRDIKATVSAIDTLRSAQQRDLHCHVPYTL